MKRFLLFLVVMLLIPCYSMIHASEDTGKANSTDADKTDKTSPVPISITKPGFPMKAQVDHVEGFVTIKFIVTKDGNVENAKVVESVPAGYFENAALTALKKYQFKPATEYGVSVDYTIEWPFFFSFPGSSFLKDVNSRMQAYRDVNNGRELIGKAQNQKAVDKISEAVKLEPGYVTAYYYRSLAFSKLEEYDNALSDIDKAIEMAPDVFGYYNHRGLIYLYKKDYQKAIENLDKSIQIEPKNIVAYIYRGDTYRESGKYDEAVKNYTSALELDNTLISAHNNRGYVYYKLKDTKDACDDFKKACDFGDCRAIDHLKERGICKSEVPGSFK